MNLESFFRWSFFWMVGVDMRFDYFWTSVTKFTLLILFSAHWAGCIYFLLARLRDFGPGTVRPFAIISKCPDSQDHQQDLLAGKGFPPLSASWERPVPSGSGQTVTAKTSHKKLLRKDKLRLCQVDGKRTRFFPLWDGDLM
jgi:hypothetical protein